MILQNTISTNALFLTYSMFLHEIFHGLYHLNDYDYLSEPNIYDFVNMNSIFYLSIIVSLFCIYIYIAFGGGNLNALINAGYFSIALFIISMISLIYLNIKGFMLYDSEKYFEGGNLLNVYRFFSYLNGYNLLMALQVIMMY